MPIMLLNTGRGHQPVIVCDHCGEQITNMRDGNYEWRENPEGVDSLSAPLFLHKACSRPYQTKAGASLLSMELVAFIPRLAHAVALTPQDQRFAATMYGVGDPSDPAPERETTPLRLVKSPTPKT